MADLVKIEYANDTPTVLARDLHAALDVKSKYADWIKNMCAYGFEEGKDFLTVSKNLESGGRIIDHQITLSMAKEICMLQRSEKGKQFRQYFISVEEAWNKPEVVMARALQISNRKVKELEQEAAEMLPKAEYYDALVDRQNLTNLRETAKLVGVGERVMVSELLNRGYLYRNQRGNLQPYAGKNRGYFAVKEYFSDRTNHSGVQTLVTMAGRELILRMFGKNITTA